MTHEYLSRLRGPKVPYFLIDGETQLLDPSGYPFSRDELPVQANFLREEKSPSFAYRTGMRSIVFPLNHHWFKAKAIGIPSGRSRPIFHGGKLLSYYLSDTTIGLGKLLWGFSFMEEAKNELYWMKKARELGLPATDPVGMGVYKDVCVLDFRNRRELFDHLNKVSPGDLLADFSRHSRTMNAACVFCREPTDVRVDEILYAFLLPGIGEILDVGETKDYLRWLGSSCANNLRLHHDNGIMHGTIPKEEGLMTNSHVANHLVGEEGTWMTDYHMAGEIRDKSTKRRETYCLSHVMNPLPYAELIGRERFLPRAAPPLELYERLALSPSVDVVASLRDYGALNARAELTEAFIDGIELGYNRRRVLDIDSQLKRDMLRRAVAIKEQMWRIYGIPVAMQRGLGYVQSVVASRKITKEELEEIRRAL